MSANYQQYPFAKGEHPSGWVETTVGEVMLEIRSGYSSGTHNQTGQGIPHLRPMNVSPVGDISMEDVRYVSPSAGSVRLAEDDVLFTNTSSTVWVGKTAVVKNPGEWGFSNHMTRLRVPDGISPEFVARQLHYLCLCGYFAFHCKKHINQSSVAGTQLAVEVPFRLPPANEQKRIAATLRRLLARERKLRQQLDQLPALIQQYRAAVLEAACTGRLVPTEAELFENGQDYESASELLSRTLKNRRAWWETQQTDRFHCSGRRPKNDDWKLKYREPHEPTAPSEMRLPHGWVWATWDQLSNWVTYGFTRPMPRAASGIPVVTAKHIKNGVIESSDAPLTTERAFSELTDKDRPQPGDILVTKDGSIGRAAVVESRDPFCINQSVAVVWLRSCDVDRRYLLYVIQSALTQTPIQDSVRGVAIPHLSITDFARMTLPLAPLKEQHRIVAEVERRLSAIRRIEQEVTAALVECSSLRAALFSHAISGKLVKQHKSDEPAEDLLARIRIEREKRKQSPKRTESQRKAKMEKLSPEVVKEAISKLPRNRFSFDELSTALQADYDPLKDIVFELLGEPRPILRQVFDSKAKAMQLERIKP